MGTRYPNCRSSNSTSIWHNLRHRFCTRSSIGIFRYSSNLTISPWCNGSIPVSKTVGRGSSPWGDAKQREYTHLGGESQFVSRQAKRKISYWHLGNRQGIDFMHRWQRGPMHWIANPENREFESHPVLHKLLVFSKTDKYVYNGVGGENVTNN